MSQDAVPFLPGLMSGLMSTPISNAVPASVELGSKIDLLAGLGPLPSPSALSLGLTPLLAAKDDDGVASGTVGIKDAELLLCMSPAGFKLPAGTAATGTALTAVSEMSPDLASVDSCGVAPGAGPAAISHNVALVPSVTTAAMTAYGHHPSLAAGLKVQTLPTVPPGTEMPTGGPGTTASTIAIATPGTSTPQQQVKTLARRPSFSGIARVPSAATATANATAVANATAPMPTVPTVATGTVGSETHANSGGFAVPLPLPRPSRPTFGVGGTAKAVVLSINGPAALPTATTKSAAASKPRPKRASGKVKVEPASPKPSPKAAPKASASPKASPKASSKSAKASGAREIGTKSKVRSSASQPGQPGQTGAAQLGGDAPKRVVAPRVGSMSGATEKREKKRAEKREKKRQKELKKVEFKRERAIKRLQNHFTFKLGLKPSNIEAVLAAAPTDPRYHRKQNMIDLCILPTSDNIPLKKPLPYPFDCISFDGRYILSVLAMTERRDTPTICRFVRVPQEDVDLLMGPMGLANPQEAYLSPSLGAAARRCYLKSTNGWSTWYVLVIHEGRTYRVALDRFRVTRGGPGFIPRPGMEFTDEELQVMIDLAAKSHPSTNEYAQQKFFELVHTMGAHSDRDVLPDFLENFLRVTPTIINPRPTESVQCGEFLMPPVSSTFLPTFCHTSH